MKNHEKMKRLFADLEIGDIRQLISVYKGSLEVWAVCWRYALQMYKYMLAYT
jgi:hypothetical protein